MILSFHARKSIWINVHAIVFSFLICTRSLWSLFLRNGCLLSRKLATLPLLSHRICCSFARYPLAPISISLQDLSRKHQKYSKITQIPTKLFSTISSTEWHFAFPYSVINSGKDSEFFFLTFALVKTISKWDWCSLYKFHPRKKWNASSDLASFHTRKRIWIGIPTV